MVQRSNALLPEWVPVTFLPVDGLLEDHDHSRDVLQFFRKMLMVQILEGCIGEAQKTFKLFEVLPIAIGTSRRSSTIALGGGSSERSATLPPVSSVEGPLYGNRRSLSRFFYATQVIYAKAYVFTCGFVGQLASVQKRAPNHFIFRQDARPALSFLKKTLSCCNKDYAFGGGIFE
jgi:hypothetical protein